MRYVVLLALVCTVGCGDDPLHPSQTPQAMYPVGPSVCTVTSQGRVLIVPCD